MGTWLFKMQTCKVGVTSQKTMKLLPTVGRKATQK
ncbi:hypothetical protein cypCar_00009124, partial [Cyprinus carpio]